MKWRTNTILILVLLAGILFYPVTSLAQIISHDLGGGYDNWVGPAWYIYSATPEPFQLVRGPYATEEQCQADNKIVNEQNNEFLLSVGEGPDRYPNRCAYFGVQPSFDKLP